MSDIKVEKTFYDNGNVSFECYRLNGHLHNENGPAHIWYYENGNVRIRSYRLNGDRHNEKGPAIISYYRNGNIKEERYYLNNEEIFPKSKENFQRIVKCQILK